MGRTVYEHRSMNGWVLWVFHVGKYTYHTYQSHGIYGLWKISVCFVLKNTTSINFGIGLSISFRTLSEGNDSMMMCSPERESKPLSFMRYWGNPPICQSHFLYQRILQSDVFVVPRIHPLKGFNEFFCLFFPIKNPLDSWNRPRSSGRIKVPESLTPKTPYIWPRRRSSILGPGGQKIQSIHYPDTPWDERSIYLLPRNPVTSSDDEQGMSNHLLSIVFRFHHHSQKVSQDP